MHEQNGASKSKTRPAGEPLTKGRKRGRAEEEHTIQPPDSAIGIQSHALIDLWRKGELCDVAVVVDGQEFPAHRVVLAAGSAYMRACFASGMRDAKAPTIEVAEMDAANFKAVIECIYTGSFTVTGSSLAPTLFAASRLEVPSVLLAGALWLETRLSAGTCFPTGSLAEQLQRPAELGSLVEACVCCTAHSFNRAAESDDWTSLEASQLSMVLKCVEIDAHEVDVFRALMRWARARKPAEEELGGLIQLVRFNSIHAEALNDVCDADPIFAGIRTLATFC